MCIEKHKKGNLKMFCKIIAQFLCLLFNRFPIFLGMPHVHGVLWLKEEIVRPYLKENGEFNLETVHELIDTWTSCSLDTGDEELDDLVKEVNTHHHTSSCQKKGFCRFNFPRLPSRRTIVATPLEVPENETVEEKKARKNSSSMCSSRRSCSLSTARRHEMIIEMSFGNSDFFISRSRPSIYTSGQAFIAILC